MSDLSSRLDSATKRRATLEGEARKAEGRLESARAALKLVQDECRAKGIDPDCIDDAVKKLENKAEMLVAQLETDIAKAEAALAPYLKE